MLLTVFKGLSYVRTVLNRALRRNLYKSSYERQVSFTGVAIFVFDENNIYDVYLNLRLYLPKIKSKWKI